jgi:hypothetical protein
VDAHTSETGHTGKPRSGESGDVQAAGDVVVQIVQVDECGFG